MGEGANKIYSVTMFFHKQKKGRLHDRAEVQNFFSSVFIHFNTRRENFYISKVTCKVLFII